MIDQAGTYQYDLAYAHVAQYPGAQPQVCLPQTHFQLTSDSGTVNVLRPAVTGLVKLTAGTWTASSGFDATALEIVIWPNPPGGAFWSAACPWSLTLTPSN